MSNLIPITPQGISKFYQSIPWDNSYKNIRKWNSVGEQDTYFATKKLYDTQNMIVIKNYNTLAVDFVADDMINVNYMSFQNSNFTNKTFYAFITNVIYKSPNSCTVEYEIDIFQTYQFDIDFLPCFVEREHVNDDTIGKNLVVENLDLGNYIINDYVKTGLSDSDKIIVLASSGNVEGDYATGGYYGGIYSGLQYFKYSSVTDLNTHLNNLYTAGKSDSVVAIFMAYDSLFGTENSLEPLESGITVEKNFDELDGYTPKNKKLYTYPYNFLYVSNLNGQSAEYKWEFFIGNPMQDPAYFNIIGETSCNPTLTLVPDGYKDYSEGMSYGNLNEKLVLSGFPQCAWTTDTYKVWLAQNSSSMAISTMGSALSVGVGLYTGNPIAVAGGGLAIADILNQKYKESVRPPQASGVAGNGGMFAYNELDFHFFSTSITSEYAQIIDDFFSIQGYQVNRVKTPNLTGRQNWNYVKTKECQVRSKPTKSCPAQVINDLKSIFNSGVTLWHTGDIGNYSLTNTIV